MLGIIFAVVAAVLYACGDIGKKRLSESSPGLVVTWIPVTVGVLLGAARFGVGSTPAFDFTALLPFAIVSAALIVWVELTFIRAISTAEISLVMPLTAFAPVTSGIVAWFVSGQTPTAVSLLGVVIIIIASWLMFADARDWRSFAAPFRKIWANPSARAMLLFCVLNGVFVNLMKHGGERSSPTFFLWIVLVGEWLILSGLMLRRRINPLTTVRAQPALALATGAFWAGGMAFLFEAFSHTLVTYAMAACRTHTIFIVLLSSVILGEHDFRKRLAASTVMVIGVAVLILGR